MEEIQIKCQFDTSLHNPFSCKTLFEILLSTKLTICYCSPLSQTLDKNHLNTLRDKLAFLINQSCSKPFHTNKTVLDILLWYFSMTQLPFSQLMVFQYDLVTIFPADFLHIKSTWTALNTCMFQLRRRHIRKTSKYTTCKLFIRALLLLNEELYYYRMI